MSDLLITLMGAGTVFFGIVCLICLVCLLYLMRRLLKSFSGKTADTAPLSQYDTAAPNVSGVNASLPVKIKSIPDRPAFIAAVSAAIAEELGTQVSAIRIRSVKEV